MDVEIIGCKRGTPSERYVWKGKLKYIPRREENICINDHVYDVRSVVLMIEGENQWLRIMVWE